MNHLSLGDVARFARVFAFAFLPALGLLAGGTSKLTIATAAPLVGGALETAWRVVFPVTPAQPVAPAPPASPAPPR